MATERQKMMRAEISWRTIKAFVEWREENDVGYVNSETIDSVLARYFGIDLDALERETRESIEGVKRAYGVKGQVGQ